MKKIFLLIPVVALLFSCGGEQVAQKKEYDYEKADSLSDEYMRNLGTIRVSIEQTSQLNKGFKDGGYSFNSSALNSASKASGYSNSKSQAINMGVFSADLNYSVLFEQTQQVTDYVKAVMDLSGKLGLQSAFNEDLIAKLTSNDTTLNKSILLTRAFVQAEDNLHSEDRAALATLMVTGGWLEALNIALVNINTKPGGGNINKMIWEHAFVYTNVIKMLEVFKDKNQDCADVLTILNGMKDSMGQVIYSKGTFTPEMISKLTEAVTSSRNSLIN